MLGTCLLGPSWPGLWLVECPSCLLPPRHGPGVGLHKEGKLWAAVVEAT